MKYDFDAKLQRDTNAYLAKYDTTPTPVEVDDETRYLQLEDLLEDQECSIQEAMDWGLITEQEFRFYVRY